MRRIYLYLSAGPGGENKFTMGTFDDLRAAGIEPSAGLRLPFYCDDADDAGNRDDLLFEGVVGYDEVRARWYAIVDWDSIRHESDGPTTS